MKLFPRVTHFYFISISYLEWKPSIRSFSRGAHTLHKSLTITLRRILLVSRLILSNNLYPHGNQIIMKQTVLILI